MKVAQAGRPGPNLSGKVFGMLTVFSKSSERRRGRSLWECVCECGNIAFVVGHSLTSGNTVSCGCKRKTYPNALKHGGTGSKIHNIWMAMRRRCSPSCTERQRPFYYEKGISVCDEWHDFEAFRSWAMENEYKDGLTIDRINGNGNYEPGNCRWATMEQQNNNSARNRLITLDGETKTLEKWASALGVSPSVIHGRLRRGWEIRRALSGKGDNNGM